MHSSAYAYNGHVRLDFIRSFIRVRMREARGAFVIRSTNDVDRFESRRFARRLLIRIRLAYIWTADGVNRRGPSRIPSSFVCLTKATPYELMVTHATFIICSSRTNSVENSIGNSFKLVAYDERFPVVIDS